MKRALFLFVLLATVFGLSSSAHAAVNDFTITDYKIDFVLGKDSEGRSTLKTTETIKAKFPDADQNHGIERYIPKAYDGHKTSLKIESVKKADGTSWEYEDSTSNDNLVLRIGDPDAYVHGEQTFIITYTQRDVTKYFDDVKRDEFYWDTNGEGWRVPIERLAVTLNVDPSLEKSLTGDMACYKGAARSDQECGLYMTGTKFYAEGNSLAAGENITLAVGFKPQTFAGYQESLFDVLVRWWQVSLAVVGAAAFGVAIWVGARWSKLHNRTAEIGPIAPEYLPPQDASVATSANLLAVPTRSFAAQLVDFAVRHYLKIYQTKEKSFWSQAEYEIEIARDISDLRAEEQEILRDIFADTAVGTRLPLKDLKNNMSVYKKTQDNDKKLSDLIEGEYAIRQVDQTQKKLFIKIGGVLLAIALIFLNPIALVASIIVFGCAASLKPLTDKGLALVRYLKGLKMYIGVAETERLAMLQSPEGAAKVGSVDGKDERQLIKLYERVLPYAVLFGQEKEWNNRIGSLYEATNSQPDWYAGNTAFNALAFSSAMGSFTSAANYSAASSSNSGGSGGGGFSGGGGGGGGGGGW